jgi:hypothetical protein
LFIIQQKKRKYISKMWTHGGDTYAINQLNIQLDNAMALFEVCLIYQSVSSSFLKIVEF